MQILEGFLIGVVPPVTQDSDSNYVLDIHTTYSKSILGQGRVRGSTLHGHVSMLVIDTFQGIDCIHSYILKKKRPFFMAQYILIQLSCRHKVTPKCFPNARHTNIDNVFLSLLFYICLS